MGLGEKTASLLSMVSRDYISEEHSKRVFDGESCDDELL